MVECQASHNRLVARIAAVQHSPPFQGSTPFLAKSRALAYHTKHNSTSEVALLLAFHLSQIRASVARLYSQTAYYRTDSDIELTGGEVSVDVR